MNSAYVVAVVGAVAGLVTGLGSALIALGIARSQDASARELQRRQWLADSLRDCYSQVGGTHRRFMLAWLDWWDEFNADRKSEQHAELIQAAAAFAAACTAVRIYAPENVVERLMHLRKLTFAFDEYAEQHRDHKRWTEHQEAEYDQLRAAADNAMPAFIDAARASIKEVLSGQSADPGRKRLHPDPAGEPGLHPAHAAVGAPDRPPG
jgi:hypothetical protein